MPTRPSFWFTAAVLLGLLGYAGLSAGPQQRRQVEDQGERPKQAPEQAAPAPPQPNATTPQPAVPAAAPEAPPTYFQLQKKEMDSLRAAKVAGEIEARRVTDPARTADWPNLAAAPDGSLWAAYIDWDRGASDRVVVQRRASSGESSGDWGAPIVLDDGHSDHYIPAIAARPDGALAVWSARVDGNFELFAAEVSNNGSVGPVERLTHADYGDFHVRAASDTEGNTTIVWQSFRAGQADIYARRFSDSGAGDSAWAPEVRISTSEANDWEPALALDGTGRAWISWDSYHAGNYDVFLASFDGNTATAPVAITSDAKASFHTTVAVDASDRVWVAWDEALENWGKDYASSSRAENSEGLHARRNLRIRVYANGRVFEPVADINAAFTGRMARFAELPTLDFDGENTPWVIFRHWTIARPTEMFHFYATRLTPQGWSTPSRLANSAGRNTQRAASAIGPDGAVRALYASDLRSRDNRPQSQRHALHYNVYLATLPQSEPGAAADLDEISVSMPGAGFQRRKRPTMALGGNSYTLLLGDCHRHTDVRGHSGSDPSLEDTYRYALDAAQMDFVGPSDHNEVNGGRWPDGMRDYQWWMAQKLVDVMTHAPHFWGVYTYEHSMGSPGGHRNILFLKRGAPMRRIDRNRDPPYPFNQPPQMWKWVESNVLTQSGQKTVIVPHTFAAGPLAAWNWPNAPFDCLLEIYQGARGSYERWRLPEGEKRGGTQTDRPGHFAQDALAKGNIYGFVSFSDHNSTHNSWAGVWVEQPTRESLFDAMLARRTFGASDEIIVRTSADGHMPGAQFTATVDAPPEIAIEVEAPDEILRVDVVKNGEYVFTQRPGGQQASFRYRDIEPTPGDTYYYVRVFQRDPENPSGDPEIAWASPFFVKYQ